MGGGGVGHREGGAKQEAELPQAGCGRGHPSHTKLPRSQCFIPPNVRKKKCTKLAITLATCIRRWNIIIHVH